LAKGKYLLKEIYLYIFLKILMKYYLIALRFLKILLIAFLFVSCGNSDDNLKPELALQLGHRHSVTSVVFSPDGVTLASGGKDNLVKLWDIGTGGVKRTLAGIQGAIKAIAFSADGKLLAACGSYDNTARLWDVHTGSLKKNFTGNDNPVTAVAISPDGKTLATGSKDTVKLWNTETGEVKQTLKVSTNDDSEIISVVFSDNGKILIVGQGNGIKLWDLQTGTEKQAIVDYRNFPTIISNDKIAAISNSSQKFTFFDQQTGKEKESYDLKIKAGIFDISKNGKILIGIGTGTTIKLWDLKTGQEKHAFSDSSVSKLSAITISPDNKWIAAGSDGNSVQLWEVRTGKKKWELKGKSSKEVKSLVFLSDDKTIVIAGDGGKATLWNTQTGEIKSITSPEPKSNILSDVEEIVFSLDGKMAASSYNGTLVGIWETQSGKLIQELIDLSIGLKVFYRGETKPKPLPNTHISGVTCFAFSQDSKTIVTGGSFDPTLKFWDPVTGKIKASPSFGDKPKITTTYDGKIQISTSGRIMYVRSIAFSPDGNTVASAWSDDKIRLCDIKTGKINSTINAEECEAIDFSPDGGILVSGSSNYSDKPDNINLWNAQTGEAIRTLKGHNNGINSVAIAPDGKTVASGSKDQSVKLWDLQTGELRLTLNGHNDGILSVAFSLNGKFLASTSDDGTAKLWNTSNGQLLVTLMILPSDKQKGSTLDWLAYTPDGHYTGTTNAEKLVYWNTGKKLVPVENYKQTFYQKDLLQTILANSK
jgi:WD40 repeat protein